MPDISTAAEAFAIVGLADVVFRLAIASSDLYFRYRNASEDVARLLSDLKNLANIVAQVRAFADEYRRSPYALDDSQVLLPQLETTLECCKQELEKLALIVSNVKSNANDAWFKQLGKSLSWTVDDQKILKSCQQIERYMTALNMTLSLNGRQNDIVLRRELKAARKDVADAHTSASTAISNLQQNVAASSHVIEQGVQQVSIDIQSSKQANSTSFLKVEKSLASGHARLNGINVAIDGRAKIINQSLSSVKTSLACGRKEQGAILRQQKISNFKITSQLDHICSVLTKQTATISLRESGNNDIFFEGENLGKIALPLMLMQTDLVKALRTLATEGAIKISRSEARWIKEEFANLLSQAHEAAALDLRSRYPKPHTRRAQRLGSTPTARTTCVEAASSRSNREIHNQHNLSKFKARSAQHLQRRHEISTAAGILVIETGASDEEVPTSDRSSSSLLALRISFRPKLTLSSVSVTAGFFKEFGMGIEQKVTRLIQTCNMIPGNSEAVIYAASNDVVGLQKLFAAGKASPYDCDECGIPLLMYAAFRGALEVYMFLLHMGADPLMVPAYTADGRAGLLDAIWAHPFCSLDDNEIVCGKPKLLEVAINNARRMTVAAIERDCDPNVLTVPYRENVLHTIIILNKISTSGSDLVCDVQLSELFRFFVVMGCELEGRDGLGYTPLLSACELRQYRIVKTLASIGADVSALHCSSQNALLLLLGGLQDLKDDENEQLCDALIAVLMHGCDPNALTPCFAVSPTDLAFYDDRSTLWTKVLNHVGYSLLETAEVDGFEKPYTWVVVSDDYHETLKLPVSNWTLEEWKTERSRISQSTQLKESTSGEDDNLSPSGEVDERIMDWADTSDASSSIE